jgi:hypothetical protein
MKSLKLFTILLIIITFSSCSSIYYYQVYKVEPTTNIKSDNEALVYEDDFCKVSYNFWTKNGNSGFLLYNKIDSNIYVNLQESFFIINGVANDYFQNRTFTYSQNSAVTSAVSANASKSVTGINYTNNVQTNKVAATSSVGTLAGSGYAVSYTEIPVINIPAHTSKVISVFTINETLFRSCDLYRFPSKSNIQTAKYNLKNSPVIFSNRIVYNIGTEVQTHSFENEFYIAEIANYPENVFYETSRDEFCGQKESVYTKHYHLIAPDKFFIRYTKDDSSIKN